MNPLNEENNWEISQQMIDTIDSIINSSNDIRKHTILELGSGHGSTKKFLDMGYDVISVEHDAKYVGLYKGAKYIYAPYEPYRKAKEDFPDTGWYDRNVMKLEIPKLKYDAILVDGPPNNIGRGGFLFYLELFNTNVPMFFDDVRRSSGYTLVHKLSARLKRPYVMDGAWIKPFAYFN